MLRDPEIQPTCSRPPLVVAQRRARGFHPDAGGRQIVVSRLEVTGLPSVAPVKEVAEGPVEEWSGTIRPECRSAEFDDYFERDDGQRFGVEPEGDEVAQAMVAATCDELPVLLWGEMVLENDYDGRRIIVTQIEWTR